MIASIAIIACCWFYNSRSMSGPRRWRMRSRKCKFLRATLMEMPHYSILSRDCRTEQLFFKFSWRVAIRHSTSFTSVLKYLISCENIWTIFLYSKVNCSFLVNFNLHLIIEWDGGIFSVGNFKNLILCRIMVVHWTPRCVQWYWK